MTETVPGPARRFSPQAIVFTALILISFLIIHYTVPFRHESVPEKPNPELMKILSEQAEQKRLRIEKLYNELEEITGGPVHDGTEKNSGELSLAMVFDSEIPHGETQNLLTYAVQAQIKEKLPDVVLLHRKSLDKILEELIREKPEHFTLRFPKLLLFLEVGREKSRTFVLMQLVQKKTSEVSAVFVETLDDSELVLEQKDKIAANLIAHLQKYMEKNQGGKI